VVEHWIDLCTTCLSDALFSRRLVLPDSYVNGVPMRAECMTVAQHGAGMGMSVCVLLWCSSTLVCLSVLAVRNSAGPPSMAPSVGSSSPGTRARRRGNRRLTRNESRYHSGKCRYRICLWQTRCFIVPEQFLVPTQAVLNIWVIRRFYSNLLIFYPRLFLTNLHYCTTGSDIVLMCNFVCSTLYRAYFPFLKRSGGFQVQRRW
jgi:hypothetical protein